MTVITNTRLQNAYPGTHDTSNSAFLSAAISKHTESSDYLSGHDGRPDRGQADGPRDAAGLAPARDGSEPARRRVQQRLRVRLSELPLLVVADDPASVRGASARRLRAPVRRGRQCGRAPRGAAQSGKPARFVHEGHRAGSSSAWAFPIACAWISISTVFVEVEREIERAEQAVADNKTPDLDRPVGVPAAFADHAKLMFDLQILAFQADITRVITFQLTREQSNRTYPEIGVRGPAPSNQSSRQRSGKGSEDREDQHVPCFAVFGVPPENEGHSRWRRLAPRSLGLPVRQRHGQSQPSRSREPSDPGRGRRRNRPEGRPAHQVREGNDRWPTSTSRCSIALAFVWIRSGTAPEKSKTSSIPST